ncbi:MAG TPA: cupin-like domain-containing protein [Pseudomonadales bacterium]|nr:cupin-like domain-containing protein [Pseudomonadales bacterium]
MIYDALPLVSSITPEKAGVIPSHVFESEQPVVIKGLVNHWPAVSTEEQGFKALAGYLARFWTRERPVTAYVAGPTVKGRFGYNEAFNNFNFKSGSAPLPDVMERLMEQEVLPEDQAGSIYVGSTPVDQWLPGFQNENALSVPGMPLVNFWMGNKTTVSAHYDFPHNVACVVRGRRRFTFFPTSQIDNLYVGPIDRTPSGQPISLVNFDQPDFEAFPLFTEALKHAQTVVLEAGDAIFIPSMWWHHVKSLSSCNMLVNYWWIDDVSGMRGSPFNALLHAVMGLRHLSPVQKKAWQHIFNYYIFESDRHDMSHIPAHAQGYLGELKPEDVFRLRSDLINRLNQ